VQVTDPEFAGRTEENEENITQDRPFFYCVSNCYKHFTKRNVKYTIRQKLAILIIFSDLQTPRFLCSPVNSSLSVPNILLSNLFSSTLLLVRFFNKECARWI
jgi:hypothetical protein